MEKEKMKRKREIDDETEPRSLDNNNNNDNYNAKKRDLYGSINLAKDQNQQKEVESTEKASSSKTPPQPPPWDSHLALGVFDFPWLKDGVMSKTEDNFLDFEDKFTSSLENQDGFQFSEAYSYCETPETSKMVMDSTMWQSFEGDYINGLEIKAEDVDCIWSSLINKKNHEGKILM